MNFFRKEIDVLLGKAADLGRREVTMPIDIFSLARDFADLPDRMATFERTRIALLPHPNAFVRRVFFTMLKFMEDAGPPRDDLRDVVLAGLQDRSAWVQYDAAWLAGDRRVSTSAIVAKLKELAASHDPSVAFAPGSAEANLRERAAQSLAVLEQG